MKDACAREITYLRLSVTDLCDLRCRYCMPPEGVPKRPHSEICSVEELVEIGELGPDEIDVPAPIVDMVYVRQGEKKPFCPMWKRNKAKAEAKAAEGGKK